MISIRMHQNIHKNKYNCRQFKKQKTNQYQIMDFLRQIVSGPKHRYKLDGYNLDLTYVTPRIIAMAYPADGIEKLYRNSIDTVSQFLNENHQNRYQIINVSGREINSDKLSNIHSFYWEDHKTPEFQTLFIICEIMMEHLLKDVRNICVVHCNHGKGRTGTLICCFLLYAGYFDRAQDAMKFYQTQRFEKQNYGVTQPCQIKYIEYFNEILRRPKIFPMVLSLHKIQIKGGHHLRELYFKLWEGQHNDYCLNTKDSQMQTLQIQKQNELIVKIRRQAFFIGDCVLQIKHHPVVGKKIAATYVFNTAFLNENYKNFEVNLNQLSPLSSVKSGNFQKDFKLGLSFRKLCSCDKDLQYDSRCSKCKPYFAAERKKWQLIYEILERKPQVSPQWLLFGISEAMSKQTTSNKDDKPKIA